MTQDISFINQINEDIQDYQSRFPYIQKMKDDDWAFNFWILDKLYCIDEDIIENYIVDYHDLGIDCYVWHEDTRDLYLIQNKHYSEETRLDLNYVRNDFLVRPLGALENGTYSHCPELQGIFNKYKDDDDFSIHLVLYVTNNSSRTESLRKSIEAFNVSHIEDGCDAKIYWLDDIKELYYDTPVEDKKGFNFEIKSINKGTILNINSEDYGLKQKIDAKYVFTPVLNLYELCKKSKSEEYPLFDSNIREYLGSRGAVNKGIKKTLLNEEDRQNFFYYNNGITMIVKDMGRVIAGSPTTIEIVNPQIVNGCQTVSTIFDTLSEFPEDDIKKRFADTYVMVKILKIPKQTSEFKQLSRNIVIYNNSQNSIDSKTFEALSSEFGRLQKEFKRKGFLICLKQSDVHKFTEEYKVISPLLKGAQPLLDMFGICNISKAKDLMFKLEKLLQIFISFNDAHDAVQNKSKLLQKGSPQSKYVLDFIKNSEVTINDQIMLLLLYMRTEQERKNDVGDVSINPFFLINCFGRYDCKGDAHKISTLLKDSDDVNNVIEHYKLTLRMYGKRWQKKYNKGYNDMIKSPIDYELMDDSKDDANSVRPLNLGQRESISM